MHTTDSNNGDRTKFGVYAPTWLVLRMDEIRKSKRTDLDSRSAAVVEAMEEWVERNAGKVGPLKKAA